VQGQLTEARLDLDDEAEVDGADVVAVIGPLSGVLTSGEGDDEAAPAIANRCIFPFCRVEASRACISGERMCSMEFWRSVVRVY